MADPKLCKRYKFGYCKFNMQCRFKHNSEICENVSCTVTNCDKRHPVECWWYNRFGRCKFTYCAYSHPSKVDFKTKIAELEKMIKEKETEMKIQIAKINEIKEVLKEKENKMNIQIEKINKIKEGSKEKELEERIKHLEKFVLILQDKVESKEFDEYMKGTWEKDISGWGILDPLVRRPSLEIKCDQCDYVGRNSARLKKHIEVKHRHICTICNYSEEFETRDQLVEHTAMVHENLEKELTQEQFDNLSEKDLQKLQYTGGDTPRKRDVKEKYRLRQKSLKTKN